MKQLDGWQRLEREVLSTVLILKKNSRSIITTLNDTQKINMYQFSGTDTCHCWCAFFLLFLNEHMKTLSDSLPSLRNLPPLWLLSQSIYFTSTDSLRSASSTPLCPTVLLPYMYTWSGYVNFDMWVSIFPIFTMGFIGPWLVFRANLEVKRKTPLAVCKPTLRVPLLGTAYLQGSCLFC